MYSIGIKNICTVSQSALVVESDLYKRGLKKLFLRSSCYKSILWDNSILGLRNYRFICSLNFSTVQRSVQLLSSLNKAGLDSATRYKTDLVSVTFCWIPETEKRDDLVCKTKLNKNRATLISYLKVIVSDNLVCTLKEKLSK